MSLGSEPVVGYDLARALDGMTDAYVLLDRDWRIVYANRRTEQLVGIRREELLGRNHWEVFPETMGTEVERCYRAAMENGESQHFEYYFDPLTTWFELYAHPHEHGMVVYFRDVTKRRQADIALEERQEQRWWRETGSSG